ncbi:hypothetical protein OESDEN_15718, partial [Oesophagostomum dentatum]
MRRLQQAIYEQQMLREAMMRDWMEQQRRAAAEEELARSIAQARWEQTQRARAAEEYQAEMQRAQWAQAQRALWERAQMAQMHQQMHQQMHGMMHPPFWQHPWLARFVAINRTINTPLDMSLQMTQRDIVVFPRITPPQEPQIPMRPHDASPAQILSMQQPTVPPAPEMGMHDRIYQEMQKKSQGMEFNVPSRQIWTAVTPTPETPGNYDHDAIFQENLRKIQEQQSTTVAPPTTVTEKVAEIKPVESDNVFRDILSVFDDAEKKEDTEATTVENVVKEEKEEEQKSTEAPKVEKEAVSDVVDNAAQVETSTEAIPKDAEIPKPDENIFKIVEEAKPDMPRPEEIHVPDPDVDEAPEPVFVEDRFPRIEDRTTVPVEATTAATTEETD